MQCCEAVWTTGDAVSGSSSFGFLHSLERYGGLIYIFPLFRIHMKGDYIKIAIVNSNMLDTWMQAEHKIQSRNGGLKLELTRVPKALGIIRREWLPEAMITSFKLETDESILLQKARDSILMYGVDCIVANLLHTRKNTVYIITGDGDADTCRIDRPEDVCAIERLIIEKLITLHAEIICNK